MAFTLRQATPDDIPGMLDVWYTAFNSAAMLSIFPDSVPTRAWVAASIASGMDDPAENTVYMIMTDNEKDGRVVALSKWVVHPGGGPMPVWNKRWPAKVAEDMSEKVVAENFFQPMERQHEKVVGDRAHYFLEILATHDEYRMRGLGGQLLAWGSDNADLRGVECYLDSAPLAKALYERNGYVDHSDANASGSFAVPMLRPAGIKMKRAGSKDTVEVDAPVKTIGSSV